MKIENAPAQVPASDRRAVGQAMWRGVRSTCPQCGTGSLFSSYLKVSDECAGCGTELHHHRADDAPPYFTIFIVGHIVIAGVLALEQAAKPSAWLHAAVWMPLTLILSLILLPRIKGALVGLQWALRMHGFDHRESVDGSDVSDVDAETAPVTAPVGRI